MIAHFEIHSLLASWLKVVLKLYNSQRWFEGLVRRFLLSSYISDPLSKYGLSWLC